MSYTEIQSSVKELSRVEKLGLIQFIVLELAKEEGINLIKDRDTYPVWSPYEAFEASDILYEALKNEKIIYE